MGNICPSFNQENNGDLKDTKRLLNETKVSYQTCEDDNGSEKSSVMFENDPLMPRNEIRFLKSKHQKREFLVEQIQEMLLTIEFNEAKEALQNLDLQKFDQILDETKSQNFNLWASLEPDHPHTIYLEAEYEGSRPVDAAYFSILTQDTEQCSKLPKNKRIKEYEILAYFAVENMKFFLIHATISNLMFYQDRKVLFIWGVKEVSENTIIETMTSIKLDLEQGNGQKGSKGSVWAEIKQGYGMYVYDLGSMTTRHKLLLKLDPKLDLRKQVLRPLYKDICLDAFRVKQAGLAVSLKEGLNTWAYQLSIMDRIYR